MERKFDDIKTEITSKKSNDKDNKNKKQVESRYKESNINGNEYSGMNSALLNQ